VTAGQCSTDVTSAGVAPARALVARAATSPPPRERATASPSPGSSTGSDARRDCARQQRASTFDAVRA
jgi:hypothetical protein